MTISKSKRIPRQLTPGQIEGLQYLAQHDQVQGTDKPAPGKIRFTIADALVDRGLAVNVGLSSTMSGLKKYTVATYAITADGRKKLEELKKVMKFKIGDRVTVRLPNWERGISGRVVNVLPGLMPDGPIVEPYCVKRDDRETPGWFKESELTLIADDKQTEAKP
jgi:hypothetical protein